MADYAVLGFDGPFLLNETGNLQAAFQGALVNENGYVTTTITPPSALWSWTGGVPNFNSKTAITGGIGTWSWSGGVPVVNVKTMISAAQATWAWFGNRVTSFPTGGGGGGGMVQGIVRGLVRVIVRGTNVGKP